MLKRDKQVGEYILIEKLGSGGFGEVWKAEKRTVFSVSNFAIKFFRADDDDEIDVNSVIREVEIWQKLSGLPHVISVIEANQFEEYVYIVSEFADGGSLDKWLTDNKGMANSHDQAVAIINQVLMGLESMHSTGFVHRDLKPANILLKKNILFLADFGISRQMKTHSKTAGTAGTYHYMPPEAFESEPIVSVHTDIWAAGVLLHKLLSGVMPFPQKEIPSLLGAIVMHQPLSLPETVPFGLREVVKKALQKKRQDRFQTACEMREALTNALTISEPNPDLIDTIVDEEQTTKTIVDETQDWREIEAKNERDRKLEEAKQLKVPEEEESLQEIEVKKQQAELDHIQRELQAKQLKKLSPNYFVWVIGSFGIAFILLLSWVTLKRLIPFVTDNKTDNRNTSNNKTENKITSNTSTNSNSNSPLLANVKHGSNSSNNSNNQTNTNSTLSAFDYFQRGQNCMFTVDDYKCEIQNYSKAIELNPQYAAAFYYRGKAYDAKGNYDQAILDYTQSVELAYVYLHEVYDSRGVSYDHKGNYEQAIKDYSKAIEINSTYALAYKHRGDAYTKTGQKFLAMADYKTYEFLSKKNNTNNTNSP